MTIKNLNDLLEVVEKLHKLLEDPQPGLASWVKIYGDYMQAISDFWNNK